MAREKPKFKVLRVRVTVEVANKYYETCERLFDVEKKGDIPLRNFVHNFIRENAKQPKIK